MQLFGGFPVRLGVISTYHPYKYWQTFYPLPNPGLERSIPNDHFPGCGIEIKSWLPARVVKKSAKLDEGALGGGLLPGASVVGKDVSAWTKNENRTVVCQNHRISCHFVFFHPLCFVISCAIFFRWVLLQTSPWWCYSAKSGGDNRCSIKRVWGMPSVSSHIAYSHAGIINLCIFWSRRSFCGIKVTSPQQRNKEVCESGERISSQRGNRRLVFQLSWNKDHANRRKMGYLKRQNTRGKDTSEQLKKRKQFGNGKNPNEAF